MSQYKVESHEFTNWHAALDYAKRRAAMKRQAVAVKHRFSDGRGWMSNCDWVHRSGDVYRYFATDDPWGTRLG